jgi:Tfp pilus assembly PilM family ATPase
MARNYPSDIIVLDTDGLLHARVSRARGAMQIDHAKAYRYPGAETFQTAVVTPDLADEASFSETLRRVRMETGKWDRVSVLLPDSWFRINLIELPALSDRPNEAMHAVRWSLKRTLPIPPESLRVAYEVLGRTGPAVKLFVLSALEKTLATIERLFSAAGIEVVLIEPVGLNIWNAITVKEQPTPKDRIFVYLRDHDFTTAVFRGSEPLFIRSRNLSGERTVQQEIRLSASYLRDSMQAVNVERCYLAGNRADEEVSAALASEFNAPVVPVTLRDHVAQPPSQVMGMDAELTACTGVFTG